MALPLGTTKSRGSKYQGYPANPPEQIKVKPAQLPVEPIGLRQRNAKTKITDFPL